MDIEEHLAEAKRWTPGHSIGQSDPAWGLRIAVGHLTEAVSLLSATSPVSSAPTTGLAKKLSASSTGTPVVLTENQAAILTPLVEAIGACIKSTQSTRYVWTMTYEDSSILLRMWQPRTPSGEKSVGLPGPVVPEYSHIPEQRVRPEGETP